MHEQYSGSNIRNDIALLQLDGSVALSAKVNTVCLPQSGSRAQVGARCYITGMATTTTMMMVITIVMMTTTTTMMMIIIIQKLLQKFDANLAFSNYF